MKKLLEQKEKMPLLPDMAVKPPALRNTFAMVGAAGTSRVASGLIAVKPGQQRHAGRTAIDGVAKLGKTVPSQAI